MRRQPCDAALPIDSRSTFIRAFFNNQGRIVRIPDPQNGVAYYVVHVDVTDHALSDAGNLHLTAGMPGEVFIRTDKRSALDYLTAPVTAYLRRRMREPL